MADHSRGAEGGPSSSSSSRPPVPGGLHLPITNMASLHLSGHHHHVATTSVVDSSSNCKTKAAGNISSFSVNNNSKPKRAGFSLPLAMPSNLLPSTTSVGLASSTLVNNNKSVKSALNKSVSSAAVTSAQFSSAAAESSQSAQSKRCRFAVKDASSGGTANQPPPQSFHTSTSSNASTVIEQPQSKLRRSRSPNRKSSMENGIMRPTPAGHHGGIEFKAPLMIEQAEELMLMAKLGKTQNMGLRVMDSMPNNPRGGTMFLLNTTTFDKDGSRDGYMWTEILHQSDLVTSKENHLDYRHYYISTSLGDGHRRRTSSKFRREAYTMGDLTLITYIGDEREAFMEKPPPPPVSLQATTFHSLPRSHRYDKRPAESSRLSKEGRLHSSALNVVQPRPRSLERTNDLLEHDLHLRRLQAMRSSPAPSTLISRLGHPAGIQEGLIALSEELAAGKLVKNLTLFPALQITLVHPDMTREFEHACQVLYSDPLLLIGPSTITQPQDGMRLFYDITIPIGKLFVTILTFVNGCYEGHPIMPLAVNIHERQFKSSHSLFWARVVGDIPALQKHRFPLMIDDAEPAVHLAVRAQAPNLVQLEGWSHRFRDIDRYLRAKGYGEEAINYFKACVCYLLNSPSKQAMHDRFRKEFEYVWPKDFVLYYRQRLLPRSGRLGRWAMAKLNICENSFLSPHANPQERFFKLVNGFRHWESLSLEQMIRAFNYLFVFFINELSLRDTGNGAFVLKTAYQPHFHKFHHPRWQNMIRVPHPTEISAWVTRNHPVSHHPGSRPPSRLQHQPPSHFRPSLMATYTDTGAFSESFDDVQEMEEALDRLLRESEEEDAMFFDELIRPTFSVFNNAQKLRQAKFQQSAASSRNNYHSSSFSSNVPSPAPNGQVPSPAPEDQCKTSTATTTASIATQPQQQPQQPQQPPAAVTGSSISSSCCDTNSGGGTINQSKNVRNSVLSTIPEVSSQREQGTNNMNNNHKSQPPDLIVHSTTASNWQEHSFDSSIVTEGHYDASFESEGLPAEPVVTSSGPMLVPRSRPPPLAHSAKRSVFSVSSVPETNDLPTPKPPQAPTVTSSSDIPLTKPSSLMLWKKVQHYVVVGGAFVGNSSSSQATTASTNPQETTTTTTQALQ